MTGQKVTVILVFLLLLGACTVSAAARPGEEKPGIDKGQGPPWILPDSGSLSEEEEEDILYIREEEKVARDIYRYFITLWHDKVFSSIATSEKRHMDAMLTLINRYGLEDPALPGMGDFQNQDLQDFYNSLKENGTISRIEALKAGCLVEETDIIDLWDAIERTDNDDIKKVYTSLELGSENHLRAFVKNLDRLGVTYEPQRLSEEEYNRIING